MHDHGPALSDDAMDSGADDCSSVLVDLPCGCQDVYYNCGYVDHEHDHVTCGGTSAPGVTVLNREQGRAMLSERTRSLLGMSLEEFEAAHDARTLDLVAPHVAHLVMLLPFARDVPAPGDDAR